MNIRTTANVHVFSLALLLVATLFQLVHKNVFRTFFFFFSVVALFTRTFMPPQTSKRFFDADAQKEPVGESGSEMGFSDGEQT